MKALTNPEAVELGVYKAEVETLLDELKRERSSKSCQRGLQARLESELEAVRAENLRLTGLSKERDEQIQALLAELGGLRALESALAERVMILAAENDDLKVRTGVVPASMRTGANAGSGA